MRAIWYSTDEARILDGMTGVLAVQFTNHRGWGSVGVGMECVVAVT